jgi:predicted dehydrogenase
MTSASVGIVGTGSIAAGMHIPVLRAMPLVCLAWVTDVDDARGREIARINRIPFASIDADLAGLPPCDMVLLAIPLLPRRSYFDHYAKTGTVVIAEKPLAVNAAEHRRLTNSFAPWQLAVGYQRRCYATSRFMREIIHSGAFGTLQTIRIAEGGRVTRTGMGGTYQDEGVARGGGIIKNLGCHSLDLAFWMTGANKFSVKDRRIEWDGDTDRRGAATIRLIGVAGVPAQECELVWTVSWLEAVPNTIDLQFERAVLRCPVAPSDGLDLINHNGQVLGKIDATASGGAVTSMQACYREWEDVIRSAKDQRASNLSAVSCEPAARLMDELLDR